MIICLKPCDPLPGILQNFTKLNDKYLADCFVISCLIQKFKWKHTTQKTLYLSTAIKLIKIANKKQYGNKLKCCILLLANQTEDLMKM